MDEDKAHLLERRMDEVKLEGLFFNKEEGIYCDYLVNTHFVLPY